MTTSNAVIEIATPVSRTLARIWSDEHEQFRCPVCDFEYVHWAEPLVIDSHDDYKARPGFVRGNVLVVPMWCENGDEFALEIGFHKGGTFVRWVVPSTGGSREKGMAGSGI